MGLRETLNNVVKSAMNAIDDIPEQCTYMAVSATTYTAASSTITKTSTAYLNVKIVFLSYDNRRIDGSNIRPEDQQAILAAVDLPVTPTTNDTITRPDGTVWAVVGVRTDLNTAYWELQVRRP